MLPLVAQINPDFLLQDEFLRTLDSKRIVFALPASILEIDPVIAKCKALHNCG